MKFIVENEVLELGLKIKAVIINNVDNKNISNDYIKWRDDKVKKLILKYKDYDIKQDDIIDGFYKLHQKVNIPRRKNLPASANLINSLVKKEQLVNINKVVDIYNLISIDSKLCLGAHDIDKIDGNVTLKITNGSENYLPIGSKKRKTVNSGEYSFVDDNNDIICWSDIRQVDKTKVDEESKNILYFIIGNEKTPNKLLDKVANEIIKYTTMFCGGSSKIIK